MRPVSDAGEELRATFAVAGAWPQVEVTFESGDGRGRNTDYNEGVRLVLSRLGEMGAALTGARISSSIVTGVAGLDPAFAPTGFALPLGLGDVDHDRLRRALAHAGALVNSRPGSSGSATRRMTLDILLAAPEGETADLEARLTRGSDGPLALTLLADVGQIDAAMTQWAAALMEGSPLANGAIGRLPAEAIVFQPRPSDQRPGVRDFRLGVRASGAPWTVEIKAPRLAADDNGLSTVATDPAGRRYLLRQGWLRANPDSDGDVKWARFRALSGLQPVDVALDTTRDWYVVADLDDGPAVIRAQTGAFVHACALARALSKPGVTAPTTPVYGGAEKGGKFRKKAVDARPETEVRRLQGEVWLALRDRLQAKGRDLVKQRHPAGYEVDGIVLGKPGTLIEIKTGASAADVYEGVGQLLIYGHLLGLTNHNRILLLPDDPQPDLKAAAQACELDIHVYDLTTDGEAVAVAFRDDFLAACLS